MTILKEESIRAFILSSFIFILLIFFMRDIYGLDKSCSEQQKTAQNDSLFNMISQSSHDLNSIKKLLENCADPNYTFMGRSFLMFAAIQDKSDIMQLLLQYGAKIDTQNYFGNTVLNYAKSKAARQLILFYTQKQISWKP